MRSHKFRIRRLFSERPEGHVMKKVMGKVYRVSTKHGRARMYFHSLICEAAGLKPSDTLYIRVDEGKEEIIIQNRPLNDYIKQITVSKKKCRTSGNYRPIVDTSGEVYEGIIEVQQKIQVSVYRKGSLTRIIVSPLRFNYQDQVIYSTKDVQQDRRIRVSSYGAGAGISTSALVDTQYFTAVQEFELEEDSASVLKLNFPHSCVENADIRDVNEVMETDVALVTLKCNGHSNLGRREGDVFDNVLIHTAQLIKASKARLICVENVPQFFKSRSYSIFKSLLEDPYKYWSEENIESFDFGSIARRNRTYAVAFRCRDDYRNFQFPKPPKSIRRNKLKDYLDRGVDFEWKSLDTWLSSFSSKQEKDNAWKDRQLDKTFVTEDAKEIACIPKRYRSQCASNTYLLSPCKNKWRFLTINEIRKILGVPTWFEFPSTVNDFRKYEMLGQSVDCNVIKAIGNEIAHVFYKSLNRVIQSVRESQRKEMHETDLKIEKSGQLQLIL